MRHVWLLFVIAGAGSAAVATASHEPPEAWMSLSSDLVSFPASPAPVREEYVLDIYSPDGIAYVEVIAGGMSWQCPPSPTCSAAPPAWTWASLPGSRYQATWYVDWQQDSPLCGPPSLCYEAPLEDLETSLLVVTQGARPGGVGIPFSQDRTIAYVARLATADAAPCTPSNATCIPTPGAWGAWNAAPGTDVEPETWLRASAPSRSTVHLAWTDESFTGPGGDLPILGHFDLITRVYNNAGTFVREDTTPMLLQQSVTVGPGHVLLGYRSIHPLPIPLEAGVYTASYTWTAI